MPDYIIRATGPTIAKESDWEWGNENDAYTTFTVEAANEDEAEAIAEERIDRGDVVWEYADGTPVPPEVLVPYPDIATIEEAE